MHVLCNRELKQWLFVEELGKEQGTDCVFMASNGELVKHTRIDTDVKTYLDKLNQECWECLK